MSTKFMDVSRSTGPMFFSDPRRKAPRKSVLIAGEVSFGDKSRRMICQIVDMSATGARLRLDTMSNCPAGKKKQCPDRIGLYFDQRTVNVECNVVWANDAEMGVQFCSMLRNNNQRPQ